MWKNAGTFHQHNRHYSQHIQTYKPHVNGARQGQGLSHQKKRKKLNTGNSSGVQFARKNKQLLIVCNKADGIEKCARFLSHSLIGYFQEGLKMNIECTKQL